MSDAKNKYTTLISNTIIFALGTFGSKLLVFLLMPLYTSVLTTAISAHGCGDECIICCCRW